MTSKNEKLSPTMAAALAVAVDHGGELVCWRGGFWTYPNCATIRESVGYRVPAWYVGTETLTALARRGHVKFTERAPSGYPVRARITPEGKAS